MNKVDPKITAPKVVPIDRVMEQYDEQAYGDPMPDPALMPKDFFQQLLVGLGTGLMFGVLIICLL